MTIRIEWTDEEGIPRTTAVKDRVFIGRRCHGLPDDKRILICAPQVSKDHAVVTRSGKGLSVCDTSRNGTFVNGSRITSGRETDLCNDDRISIGPSELRVVVMPETDESVHGEVEEPTFVAPVQAWMTHLVADVRGYSTLSKKTDSSVVQAAMKEIFNEMGRIVHEHRGIVRNFLGDAIFAVWEHGGSEKSAKAVAACEAAVEQYRALGGILAKLPGRAAELRNIRMGWGMSTGPVTLSHYGEKKDNPDIVGDSTNLAFRLSDHANKTLPAPIVICGNTARLVDSSMELQDLGEVETKGRSGLEKVFGLAV